jgi:hypothetical protein
MAIWFRLMAGSDEVASVHIRRIVTDDYGVHTYEWTVIHPHPERPQNEATSGYVTHRDDDGAETLAWLVLGAYRRRTTDTAQTEELAESMADYAAVETGLSAHWTISDDFYKTFYRNIARKLIEEGWHR